MLQWYIWAIIRMTFFQLLLQDFQSQSHKAWISIRTDDPLSTHRGKIEPCTKRTKWPPSSAIRRPSTASWPRQYGPFWLEAICLWGIQIWGSIHMLSDRCIYIYITSIFHSYIIIIYIYIYLIEPHLSIILNSTPDVPASHHGKGGKQPVAPWLPARYRPPTKSPNVPAKGWISVFQWLDSSG